MELEKKIKALIIELKQENESRSIAKNSSNCSEYNYAVLTHKYNNTLEIVKRLETTLN
jgi:hypothetical protein